MSVYKFPAKPRLMYVEAVELLIETLSVYYTIVGLYWFNTVKDYHGTESN